MLVLARQPGEFIRIGNDIKIKVIEFGVDGVRLGFEAPAHITIHREEVWRRIKAEKAAAGNRRSAK